MKTVEKIVFYTLCVLCVVPQAYAMDQQNQTGRTHRQETAIKKFYDACEVKDVNVEKALFDTLGKKPSPEELSDFLQKNVYPKTSLLCMLVIGKKWQVLHTLLFQLSSKQLKVLLQLKDSVQNKLILAESFVSYDSLQALDANLLKLIELLAKNLDPEDKVQLLCTPLSGSDTVFQQICCLGTAKAFGNTPADPFTILSWFLLDEKLEKKDLVTFLKKIGSNRVIKQSYLHFILGSSGIPDNENRGIRISKAFSNMIVKLLQRLDPQERKELLFDIKDQYGRSCCDIIKGNDELSKILQPFVGTRFCDRSFATTVYFLERLAPAIITGGIACFKLHKNPFWDAITKLGASTIVASTSLFTAQRYGFHDQERHDQGFNPYNLLSMLNVGATALIALPHILTVTNRF